MEVPNLIKIGAWSESPRPSYHVGSLLTPAEILRRGTADLGIPKKCDLYVRLQEWKS